MNSIHRSADFALWSRIHNLPQFFINYHQLRELKRIVALAYERIPFYQKLFREHDILPEHIKTLEDICHLPIINKQMLRQFPVEAAMDASFPPRSFIWRETSGSTGEPLRLPHSAAHYLSIRFGYAHSTGFYLVPFLKQVGISSTYAFEHMKFAEVRVHSTPQFRRFLHIPVSDLRDNPRGAVSKLKKFVPDILDGRPTVLVELARIVEKFQQEGQLRIPYVLSRGETLTASQRRYIKKIFVTEPFNYYGLEEVGDVAIDCEKHNGLHVHEESFIVEIIDENENPLPDGKTGRIVLTFFYNDILPLVRYDTGDQGFIISELCECGVRARRIFVNGRRGGFLTLGRIKFDNVEFSVFLTEFSKNILRWQVAKVRDDKIEIRVIPASVFSSTEADELRDKFYQHFGFHVEIKIVEDIVYGAGGKARPVIDETSPAIS